MATMVSGLGGAQGYGSNSFKTNGVDVGNLDDGAAYVDLSSAFPDGLDVAGSNYSGLYINSNGAVTFGGAETGFAESLSTADNPMIAVFLTDTNLANGGDIFWDVDDATGTVTVTWHDVAPYSGGGNNSYQLILSDNGGGDFGAEVIYETIDFTNGGSGTATAGTADGVGNFTALEGSGDSSILSGYASNDFDGGDPPGTVSFAFQDGVNAPRSVEGTSGADVMVSGYADADGDTIGSEDNIIDGGGGNDSIDGGAGDDTIYGGTGEDTISSGSGGGSSITWTQVNDADDLQGTPGADYFTVDPDEVETAVIRLNNSADSGDGDGVTDYVRIENTDEIEDLWIGDFDMGVDQIVLPEAYTGIATNSGSGFTEVTLTYANGNQQVITIFSDDGWFDSAQVFTTAEPGAGTDDDALYGGDDADTFVIEDGFGNDTIAGGEGGNDDDALDLTAQTGPVTVSYTGDEAGTLTDGTDTLEFSEIEQVQLNGGNDSLDATADTAGVSVDGGGGADTVIGGSGNDTIRGGTGSDSLEGGAGADNIRAGMGADTVRGGQGNDTLYGGDSGADSVDGGAGDDSIEAGSGNDTLIGGADNDVFDVEDTDGTMTIDGGTGSDTINFESTGANGVSITHSGSGSGIFGFSGGSAGNFTGVESFGLSGADDTLDASADTAGVTVTDAGGNDSITTGAGADSIQAGAGADTVTAGAGADTIEGGAGADSLEGGDDADTFILADGFGNDTIRGGSGGDDNDVLDLSALTSGVTVTYTGYESGTVTDGTDTLNFEDIERILLGDQSDVVDGSGGTSGIHVDGGGGNDTMSGHDGTNDTLIGGAGNDDIRGWWGDDSLVGGQGDDILRGDSGNDTLEGGAGADTVGSWTGAASLDGGDDADTFRAFNSGGGSFNGVTVTGGEGGNDDDVLDLSALSGPVTVTYTGEEAGTVTDGTDTLTFSEIERLILSDDSDSVDASITTTGVEIEAGGGADTITGGSGDDTVYGEDGNDSLDLGDGNDFAQGDGGNDTIDGGDGNDTLRGSGGDDSVFGGIGNDALTGGSGRDTLEGGAGDDTLNGQDDEDTFRFSDGFGNDTVIGGEGGVDDDVLDLSGLTAPVTVTYTGDEAGTITDGTDTITFSEIERLILTDQADSVDGTVLTSGVTIDAGDGDDTIDLAGSGHSVTAGDGNDEVELHGPDSGGVFDGGAGDDELDWDGNGMSGVDVTLTGDGAGSYDWTNGSGTGSFSGFEDFRGTAQDDTIDGGAGSLDTRFDGGDGSDSLVGGSGNDTLDGDGGNDTLIGGAGNDILFADGGDDSLEGGTGNDSLYAGTGNDTLLGGAGNDRLEVDGDDGAVTIDGGADTDTVDFDEDVAGGVTVTFDGDGSASFVMDEGASGNFSNIEEVWGTESDDSIDASADMAGMSIEGGGGADTIIGGSGSDYVDGDAGDDSITGGAGSDTLLGNTGSDTISGGAGADSIDGGDDADVIVLRDGFGADTISGGSGGDDDDVLDLSALTSGVTVSYTGTESGTVTDGTDTLSFEDIERIILGAQDDVVDGSGGAGGIHVDGGDGNDTMSGYDGADDTLIGGAGNDDMRGWGGDDRLVGGAGDDILHGDYGNDTLEGGAGNDTLGNWNGAASMDGGDDADTFRVFNSGGGDFNGVTVTGGEGGDDDDVLDLSGLSGPVTVTYTGNEAGTVTDGTDTLSFTEIERLILGNDSDSVDASGGSLTLGINLDAGGGNDTVGGSGAADTILAGDGDDSVMSGEGNDYIEGGQGIDTLRGEGGNDTILGGSEGDLIEGGGQHDSLDGGTGADTIDGGDGDDTILGGDGADVIEAGEELSHGDDDLIYAGSGDDTITSAETDSRSNDTIYGEAGNDLINVTGGDANLLDGGADNDTIISGTGNDTLIGGTGDDSLTGGSGNDSLTGGSGNDVYAFADGAGRDTITDFDLNDTDGNGSFNDQLDLSGITRLDGSPINAWDIDVSDDGAGNALLTFPRGDQLVLQGVTPAQMSSASQRHQAGVPCFTAGTWIETPEGPRLVEEIAAGDMILTKDNGPQEVVWTSQTPIPAAALFQNERLRPLLVPEGAIGNAEPILVSRQHCFLIGPEMGLPEEGLVRAIHLRRGGMAQTDDTSEPVTYVPPDVPDPPDRLCQRHRDRDLLSRADGAQDA